ncbi:ubiquinol oxidase subunit II [Vibrio sp. vnigr-6D03]|uniref:Ubiquinol oxidase subunit 2 n=1 Tax=Vibrio penaeicida TaxID=104609 RepID=A0AAV5NXG8_9VIBR|nr:MULTISPECIES: ubiquinol oxidase subunit II [Vibrio]PKF76808.1 ubiquinol oxidase subunit II [Vibrio sp. vnigr-6D03]RTZ22958.1 ubiquinol oxidase subunit II [Vibrio penaeicida]GLQ75396.1 cytochrome bo(3) ubiquinol oxidase subunit 2 [Vibrio penaeicida]
MKIKCNIKVALILTSVVGLILLGVLFFGSNMVLFDPKGPVGQAQESLIITSVLLMAIIIVPVLFMCVYFPYKYRSSNKEAEYKPNWEHSTKIEVIVWAVPCLIILALGWITYETSHSLDPRREIESDKTPLTIQVVSMNWKWLFIYPEQQIATVNEVAFPADRPVEFLVTSDTTMNSFFIPQLGSQIYAMAGMENRVNLMATEEGVYRGMSANYSGFGFANMHFKAHAVSESGFDEWVNKVKLSEQVLNDTSYDALTANAKEQIKKYHPVTYYSSVDPLRFKDIIEKHSGAQNGL